MFYALFCYLFVCNVPFSNTKLKLKKNNRNTTNGCFDGTIVITWLYKPPAMGSNLSVSCICGMFP